MARYQLVRLAAEAAAALGELVQRTPLPLRAQAATLLAALGQAAAAQRQGTAQVWWWRVRVALPPNTLLAAAAALVALHQTPLTLRMLTAAPRRAATARSDSW